MTAPRQPLTRRRLTEALARYGVTATREMLDDLIAATKRASNAPECIQTIQEYCEFTPAKVFWESAQVEITNLELWRDVVAGWVGMGWKKTNLSSMMDYYRRGEVPAPKGRIYGDVIRSSTSIAGERTGNGISAEGDAYAARLASL